MEELEAEFEAALQALRLTPEWQRFVVAQTRLAEAKELQLDADIVSLEAAHMSKVMEQE